MYFVISFFQNVEYLGALQLLKARQNRLCNYCALEQPCLKDDYKIHLTLEKENLASSFHEIV